MAKPLLVLIDGHSLIHRAWHAVKEPLVVRRTGEVVTAVYGFTNTLLKVIEELGPTHIAVTMDKGVPFRQQQAASYKAQRPEAPEELRAQIRRCHQVLEALGIPIYEQEGYEADDLLGTLARQAQAAGAETYLVTLDSDIAQLVGPGVKLYMYRPYQRDYVIYQNEAMIQERYGVPPLHIPDLKSLKGDASDNIPGVPGIGDKTAVKLLQQFGSLEALYERLAEVEPERLREALRLHADQARQSKALATIVVDAPVSLDLEACRLGGYDREAALDLFREMEFRSLVPRLPVAGPPVGPGPAPPEPAQEPAYHRVATREELAALAQRLQAAGELVFDTETTALDPMQALPVGIALSVEPGEAYYVAVGHAGGQQLPLAEALEVLGPLFRDPTVGKVAHNGKYDVTILAQQGLWTENLAFDTLIAAYLLGEGGGGRPGEGTLGLKWLASRRLGVEMTPITELIGTGRGQLSMAQVDVAAAARYACADADMTGRLRRLLEPELRAQGLWPLFAEVEMPLVPILARMEMAGVALDVAVLRDLSQALGEEMRRLEEEVWGAVGHRFNVNSPPQLSDVLFQELKLPKTRRTKGGAYSTDAQALEGLRGAHPVIDLIFDYRQAAKIKSTYLDTLPGLINPRTHRVHTTFHQTSTATGRLSSSDPNLQNIPVRGEIGGQVRRGFVARDIGPDPWLLSADYSQIELRILAHICRDEALLAAFHQDQDIHAATASQVFGVPLEQVTTPMRRRAKVFNFGVLYGLSAYGLSTREGIGREEAAQFIETYFARYPGIRAYIDETVASTRRQGYAETLLGRRRYIPEIGSDNAQVRQAAERMAINMPIQGTAADIIKIAMVGIQREMERRRLKSQMLLQVHDELIFEGPAEELAEMRALALEVMPRSLELAVPLKVDLKVGRSWGEME